MNRNSHSRTIRYYGGKPLKLAVIHGGPGGIGSCGELAQKIAHTCGIGVMEPLQTRTTIAELTQELIQQLASAPEPLTVLGHSWGAWLAALAAAERPELVKQLILVGGGPLRPGCDVDAIRRSRFTAAMREEFDGLLRQLSNPAGPADHDQSLQRLGTLCEQADSFDWISPSPSAPSSYVDGAMFAKVWAEATKLRLSGQLEQTFCRLTVPILILHGDSDPHPADGIRAVLQEHHIAFEYRQLPQCGHTPWHERKAAAPFFALLDSYLKRN